MAAQMLSWLGIFVIKPGVKAMKEINLKATIATRAAQLATNALRQKFRDAGRHLRDFRISNLASEIAALSTDPTILEKAAADVAKWGKNRVPKRCPNAGGNNRSIFPPVKTGAKQ
jgi:hypothetical protein